MMDRNFQKYKKYAETGYLDSSMDRVELMLAAPKRDTAEPKYDLLEIALKLENFAAVDQFIRLVPKKFWTGKNYGYMAITGARGPMNPSHHHEQPGSHDLRTLMFKSLRDNGFIDHEATIHEMNSTEYISKLAVTAVYQYADYDMLMTISNYTPGFQLIIGSSGPYKTIRYLRKIDFEKSLTVFDMLMDMYTGEIGDKLSLQPELYVREYATTATLLIGREQSDRTVAYVRKLMEHPNAPHNLHSESADDIAKFMAKLYIYHPDAWKELGYSVNTKYGSGATIIAHIMQDNEIIIHSTRPIFNALIERMRVDKIDPYYKPVSGAIATDAFTELHHMNSQLAYNRESEIEKYERFMKIFYMLVDNGLQINRHDSTGFGTHAAIRYASKLGVDAVKELVSRGYDVSKLQSNDMAYVVSKNEAMLKLLLLHGANAHGYIEYCTNTGKLNLVKIILDFNPLNVISQDGKTALDRILENDDYKHTAERDSCIVALRDAGAKIASEL